MDCSFNLNRRNYRLIVERKGNIFFHAHASELNLEDLKGQFHEDTAQVLCQFCADIIT